MSFVASDLELTVQRLVQRVSALESRISRPVLSQWLSPDAAARASEGRYSAYLIRTRIDMAIDSPSSTRLTTGVHYSKVRRVDGRSSYQVCWPLFDHVLQQEASN
jgi:hypothetical protein